MNSLSNNDHASTMETIAAMCRQEDQAYQTADYLHQEQSQSQQQQCNGPLSIDIDLMMDIDEDCRTKMAAWCFRVIDFCNFSRETASIAMNILDRFMLNPRFSKDAKADRKIYQLAAMSSLYTAVKIHEPEAMDPSLVSNISRGTYSEDEIEAMEMQLLQAVSWRVNPPTALAFVRQFMDLIPASEMSQATRETLYDLCKMQTEMAVSEYNFLNVKPSTVAYCSLMNGLMGVCAGDDKTLHSVWATLSNAFLGLNPQCANDNQVLVSVQTWLYDALVQQEPGHLTLSNDSNHAQQTQQQQTTVASKALVQQESCETSPRSVSIAV